MRLAGGTPAADKTEMKFQPAEAGASLSFSRYGADYLIEFECREVDSPDGCINEAQAKEFAESLFVAAVSLERNGALAGLRLA